MHNLKEIRKNFSEFAKSLEKRFVNINFSNLKKLDELNRELIQKKETLEKEKKEISKSKDESLFNKSKEISIKLEKLAFINLTGGGSLIIILVTVLLSSYSI